MCERVCGGGGRQRARHCAVQLGAASRSPPPPPPTLPPPPPPCEPWRPPFQLLLRRGGSRPLLLAASAPTTPATTRLTIGSLRCAGTTPSSHPIGSLRCGGTTPSSHPGSPLLRVSPCTPPQAHPSPGQPNQGCRSKVIARPAPPSPAAYAKRARVGWGRHVAGRRGRCCPRGAAQRAAGGGGGGGGGGGVGGVCAEWQGLPTEAAQSSVRPRRPGLHWAPERCASSQVRCPTACVAHLSGCSRALCLPRRLARCMEARGPVWVQGFRRECERISSMDEVRCSGPAKVPGSDAGIQAPQRRLLMAPTVLVGCETGNSPACNCVKCLSGSNLDCSTTLSRELATASSFHPGLSHCPCG